MANEKHIAFAREKYALCSNDDLEIDNEPQTSEGDDGVWVQAWVWVYHRDVGLDIDDDEGL